MLFGKKAIILLLNVLNVDVSSFGESKEEALRNLKEAIELYLEDESTDNLTEIECPEIISAEIEHA